MQGVNVSTLSKARARQEAVVDRDQLYYAYSRAAAAVLGGTVQDMGDVVDGPANLPLEFGVHFEYGQLGLAVVRSRFRLLMKIDGGEEVFRAFAMRGLENFVAVTNHERHPGVVLPVKTTPADWPRRDPDLQCAFLVGTLPLEVRLWKYQEG